MLEMSVHKQKKNGLLFSVMGVKNGMSLAKFITFNIYEWVEKY